VVPALVAVALSAAACGRAPAVTITAPRDGETVMAPVRVTLGVVNVELAPAADERPGTAHHHLFLDVDVTPPTDTIPAGVTGVIHLGRAQTEFTFDSLAPGPHRVIAVLGDYGHVPLRNAAADTVNFVVGPWP
jgi:hypothetical protein